ncbi:MAG: hypothetical protein ACK4L7_03605, partial [Flavobacteriales bacterium]
IAVPDRILRNFLNEEELAAFRAGGTGIFSITVSGRKPAALPSRAPDENAAREEARCGTGISCC